MSDIFVSYASEDRARAKVLAGALERQGWSVWWDRRIAPGKQFSQVIKEAIDEAKCIIVLWSKESVKSDWVQNEAAEGARREILVPALIDDVEIPFEFRRIQAAHLVDWEGRSPHPEFDQLLEAVCAIVGQPLLPKALEPTPDEQPPENEIHTLPKDKPKDDRPMDTTLPKEPKKRQTTKVLAAICIVTLIIIISIGVFLKEHNVVTNSIGMKLVYIPAGSFMMGSSRSAGQLAREYIPPEAHFADEFPQHQVRISEGFWIGQTEVTQGQYKSVINAQPWSGKDYVKEFANNPAVYVTWDEAAEFCTKLSQQEGKTYRLPTEAEWEYACRAGTTTMFSFGDSDSSPGDYAWFKGNTEMKGQGYAHPVGQKKRNPWGLYDMHGNVMEWCSDWYDEDEDTRSLRGGSWGSADFDLRSSLRFSAPDRHPTVGFRVVRSQ